MSSERAKSKIFDNVPERAYQKAMDRLNELRNEHPSAPDWDLLLLALARSYE